MSFKNLHEDMGYIRWEKCTEKYVGRVCQEEIKYAQERKWVR
jgi:hypothetical protein